MDMVPFEAIKELFSQAIYGGKIDNEFDQQLLDTILGKLFNDQAFNSNFTLAKTHGATIMAPENGTAEATSFDGLVNWCRTNLPEQQTPSWLGLPDNAEKVILTEKANLLVRKLQKCTSLIDNVEDTSAVAGGDTAGARMLATAETICGWMKFPAFNGVKTTKVLSFDFDKNSSLGRFYRVILINESCLGQKASI